MELRNAQQRLAKKPKALSWSGVITTNGTSIDHPVVIKLDTALTSLDGEPIKSSQKRKTEENQVQPTKKASKKRVDPHRSHGFE